MEKIETGIWQYRHFNIRPDDHIASGLFSIRDTRQTPSRWVQFSTYLLNPFNNNKHSWEDSATKLIDGKYKFSLCNALDRLAACAPDKSNSKLSSEIRMGIISYRGFTLRRYDNQEYWRIFDERYIEEKETNYMTARSWTLAISLVDFLIDKKEPALYY